MAPLQMQLGVGRTVWEAHMSPWAPTLTTPRRAVWAAGSSVAFSPGNLSTSSSASSTLGSPENEEYILSFETIDKMRRVSSYSALNSLIGECGSRPPPAPTRRLGTQGSPSVHARSRDMGTIPVGEQALTGVWR